MQAGVSMGGGDIVSCPDQNDGRPPTPRPLPRELQEHKTKEKHREVSMRAFLSVSGWVGEGVKR